MNKKIMVTLMLIIALSITACGAKDNGKDNNDISPTPDVEDNDGLTGDDEVDGDIDLDGDQDGLDNEDGDSNLDEAIQEELTKIRDAVAGKFGDEYVPNMPFDSIQLEELFGVHPDWYDGVIAEGPMISTQIDTFIAIHPTKDNKDNVVAALNAYKKYLVDESLQYPMNEAKTKAATIEEIDGNIYFLMLGFIDDSLENEEERVEEFLAKNKIAIDVIKEFNK